MSGWSRRAFLQASGALAIGFSLELAAAQQDKEEAGEPSAELPGSLAQTPRVDSWLEISGDGAVRVLTGKLELGQGIGIAVAQVVADELGVDLSQVSVVLADTERTPNEGYTAGSRSIESSALAVRYAAATARQRLLGLASGRLGVDVEELDLVGDRVRGGGRSVLLAELLQGESLRGEVTLPVTLRAAEKLRYIGKGVGRRELSAMVTGGALYITDLRFPEMLHARVVRPSSYQARLVSCDATALEGMVGGPPRMVRDGSFLAVVARGEWAAMTAAEALKAGCRWSAGKPLPAGADLKAWMARAPVATKSVEKVGRVNSTAAGVSHSATYFKPYIMHASVGPSCAIARYEGGKLTVWSHTQGVFPLRGALSSLLGLSESAVRVIGVPGSGCYGHNGADDVAADAAMIARAVPGRHVRVQWSRADEHRWEPYGSAMLLTLSASLDEQGHLLDYQSDLRSDSHSTRPGGDAAKLLAGWHKEEPLVMKSEPFSGGAYRNSQPLYRIPNRRVDYHSLKGPLRVSALRGLGAYANVFALECFMDELAEKARRDPFEFRLAHLDDPRAAAVLERLREVVGKEKVGIGFARYKNQASYFAAAARMAPGEGPPRVEKLWGVVEAGEIINPDGLVNQVEGGMIQSASWTLKEAVRFDSVGVLSKDWESYPIFRFEEAPQTEVHLLNRPDLPSLGAGETAQGPTVAAILNAYYRVTGRRVRDLPLLGDPEGRG